MTFKSIFAIIIFVSVFLIIFLGINLIFYSFSHSEDFHEQYPAGSYSLCLRSCNYKGKEKMCESYAIVFNNTDCDCTLLNCWISIGYQFNNMMNDKEWGTWK